MVKFRDAGPKAAYEIAVGVTAEEAAELGLAVVETDPTSGAPTAYGRYKGAPDGGPLGITVPGSEDDTHVVAGGDVGAPPPGGVASAGNKGDILNPNDPVIHGGSDEIHADNAQPPVEDLDAQRAEAVELANESIEKAQKKSASKSKK
jgi:hypothetical protein